MYKPDHPDVRRMAREIAALTAETSQPGEDSAAPDKLNTEANARGVSENHRKESIGRPDNPAYVALTRQIEGIKRELNQLAAVRSDLRTQQRMYDARLQQIPEIEREYHDLTRDYDNAKARYQEVKEKQMRAVVSQELEKGRKAERFSLGEPANLPQTPFSPNRRAIAAMGLMAALGSGLGLAGLRDALDPAVKGPLELARIVRVPILTPIPYIETRRERVGKRRRNWLLFCLYSVLAIGFLWGVHVFLKPLPPLLHSLTSSLASRFAFW